MGGVGKTETTLQFLQNPRVREIYWAVFWTDCSSDTSTQDSFDQIGKAIRIGKGSIQEVKDQLGGGSRLTLLILDSCDNPAVNYSNKYMPFASHVRITLTGRTQECVRYASHMYQSTDYQLVESLGMSASTELILLLLKQHRLPSVDNTIAQLAEVLGHHLLVIRIACSFIRRYTFTMSDYIAQLGRAQDKDDLDFVKQQYLRSQFLESAVIATQYQNIYDTFDVSARELFKNKFDSAAMWALSLLDFAACVDRTDISLESSYVRGHLKRLSRSEHQIH